MTPVNDILSACDAAGVRVWRAGDAIKFAAPHGMPADLADMLRDNKAVLLDTFPNGYGWSRGAVRGVPANLRSTCLRMAEQRGWPLLSVPLPDDEGFSVVVDGPEGWAVFTARQNENAIASALLLLDGVAEIGRQVA